MIIDTLAQHDIKAKVIYPNPLDESLDILGHILRAIGVKDMLAGDVEIKIGRKYQEKAREILDSEGIYYL